MGAPRRTVEPNTGRRTSADPWQGADGCLTIVRRILDPVALSPQLYSVRFENDRVRVLEYRLKPGGKEPMHSREVTVQGHRLSYRSGVPSFPVLHRIMDSVLLVRLQVPGGVPCGLCETRVPDTGVLFFALYTATRAGCLTVSTAFAIASCTQRFSSASVLNQ